jgi:hypothetical protein
MVEMIASIILLFVDNNDSGDGPGKGGTPIRDNVVFF